MSRAKVEINMRLAEQIGRQCAESGVRQARIQGERELIEILTGPRTGAVYTEYFARINGKVVPVGKRSKPHQASAPGEAPARDSGRLIQSVTSEQSAAGGTVTGRVGASADYIVRLELGTRHMEPRPSVSRLVNEPERRDRLKSAFDNGARRGMRTQ